MKNRWNMSSLVLFVITLAVMVICVKPLNAAVVFQDNFDDINLSAWTPVESVAHPNDIEPAIESNLLVEHSPYLALPYRTLKADLGQTVSDFKVKWKWSPTEYGMWGFLFLTNASGSQGYGVSWCSGTDDPPSAKPGFVNISRWDDPDGFELNRVKVLVDAGNPGMTQLLPSSPYLTGDSIALPFAEFEFSLNGGKLRLAVTDPYHSGGPLTVINTDFTSFSKIYLSAIPDEITEAGGMLQMHVDQLKVFPYEPTTCDEVGRGGYNLAADMNGDCVVDLADLAGVAADFLSCNDPENAGCESTW